MNCYRVLFDGDLCALLENTVEVGPFLGVTGSSKDERRVPFSVSSGSVNTPISNRAEICCNPFAMASQYPTFTISENQPLIGIAFEEKGKEVVRYFSVEAQADRAISNDTTEEALQLAGAWSDLSWDEMEHVALTT